MLIADLEDEHQADIELLMHPIASNEGIEFNLNAMIRMAMEHYTLNPLFDIYVDYWLESL